MSRRFKALHNPRYAALSRKKLAHETLGSLGIGAFLDQNIYHETILIHRSSKNVMLTFDRYYAFIQVLFITKARCAATDITGIGPSKFLSPFVRSLMGDEDRTIIHHVFNHAIDQWKAETEFDHNTLLPLMLTLR